MFNPTSFDEICRSMQTRAIVRINQCVGTIQSISAEDGNGKSWIVTMNGVNDNLPEQKAGIQAVFVRTQ